MTEKEVVIVNKTGLHARPADEFVRLSNTFESKIMIKKEDRVVDAKSILGILTLGAVNGSHIKIMAEGKDESQAVEELSNLIESGFNE